MLPHGTYIAYSLRIPLYNFKRVVLLRATVNHISCASGQVMGTQVMANDDHWNEARTQLRQWMAAHGLSQNRLARLAGLNRSIIHRFLEKDQPLSQKSAGKLYQTIRLNMDPAERQHWIEWLDLTQ